MPLHLVKLCVGVDSVEELKSWIAARMKERRKRRQPIEHVHVTRMMPKRAAELVGGGSLYWVVRGQIACRQKLIALRPFRDKEGVERCRILLEPKLVLTEPRPHRAFQGWRYLDARDAPEDLARAAPGAARMPEHMRRELRDLGLL